MGINRPCSGYILSFTLGIATALPIILLAMCPSTHIERNVNIVGISNLIVTIVIAITIPFLINRWINNKRTSKDLIVSNIQELIAMYHSHTLLLLELKNGTKSLTQVQEEMQLAISRVDMEANGLDKLVSILAPKLATRLNIRGIPPEYFDWLTGGDFLKSDFQISLDFLKMHEEILRQTTLRLKLLAQQVVLYS